MIEILCCAVIYKKKLFFYKIDTFLAEIQKKSTHNVVMKFYKNVVTKFSYSYY